MSEKLSNEAILSGIEYYKALSEKYKKLKMEADYMKDGMPDVHRSVLVKADAYHVAQLVFNDKSSKTWGVVDSMYWVVVNDCWMPLSQVTHWMPLPKPPKD